MSVSTATVSISISLSFIELMHLLSKGKVSTLCLDSFLDNDREEGLLLMLFVALTLVVMEFSLLLALVLVVAYTCIIASMIAFMIKKHIITPRRRTVNLTIELSHMLLWLKGTRMFIYFRCTTFVDLDMDWFWFWCWCWYQLRQNSGVSYLYFFSWPRV